MLPSRATPEASARRVGKGEIKQPLKASSGRMTAIFREVWTVTKLYLDKHLRRMHTAVSSLSPLKAMNRSAPKACAAPKAAWRWDRLPIDSLRQLNTKKDENEN
ncbi:MAG: hypothetical protein COV91_01935 [Candidatus Taylorbacteria bacterium CG11_big_fil_rev_8_21_14_0_20_46_11]|uniref:Uncharacterized protein n=1 Tax=Candidatus Taylorbacteria bacterium CG11_big_fil_rev_8_21_14_0_20_46_11 TaxID=1975025 RepID=A0A2H0KC69_9BACT|nr:MAG: hypothetical protein COV91_01935 [Candidatus Taylorbacteria bacterium CG11_big_fil_rev_8_21_14_0_20_46_11]